MVVGKERQLPRDHDGGQLEDHSRVLLGSGRHANFHPDLGGLCFIFVYIGSDSHCFGFR
jgi:hypothetical protein